MRRLALNVLRYFLFIPGAFLVVGLLQEEHLAPWYWWWLYYVFTTPSWPGVLLLIPLTELAAWVTRKQPAATIRRTVVILNAVVAGGLVALVWQWGAVFFAIGGALFGAFYETRNAKQQQPSPARRS